MMDLRVLAFFAAVIVREVYAQCALATTQALCVAVTCDGFWDATTSTCIDCSTDQTTCEVETECNRRWILGACTKKCTNALTTTDCTACYGKWNGSSCYDCMQDQSSCVDICARYWVVDKCWDCASNTGSCTNALTCNGEWRAAVPTCDVCWVNEAACESCNRYWDAATSTCINCQLDQTTCETAAQCNGYWDSGTSFCTLCSLNKANCQSSVCGGVWDSIANTCENCSNDERQCTLCLKNWLFGSCVNCNSGFNTCTSIKYCNGEWNVSSCTICSQDSATCTATGVGNCNGNWVAGNRCDKCDNNLTECSKCSMNWIPGIANTCVNCNQSQAYCETEAVCNGVWQTSTNTCEVCNGDSGTCASCPLLRFWSAGNLCINCFQDATKCAACGFFWVPSNANYDSALSGTCVDCNVSEDVCTSKTKCNGFWNAGASTCTIPCNQSSAYCSSCGGSWDSTNLLCNVCSKTSAECTICKQWVVGTCTNCLANSTVCKSANCGGIWTTATSSCLVCNQNSTNCQSCGGFWKNTKCNFCDSDQITCSQCGGFYTGTQCMLENDKYTCDNLLASYFKEPIWNGLRCFDCDESQYVCNKECFRVWTDESCSATSCSLDVYTCETLCHQSWNYSQGLCYHVDIDEEHICFVENDAIMLNGKCIQCHASLDLCTVQCNQAYSGTAGTRTWVNQKCTNCQADATTCTTVCQMDWITVTVSGVSKSVCMKCNASAASCSICQGQWDSTLSTCSSIQTFCNTSSAVCLNQCAFEPKIDFFYSSALSKCLYCDLNQFTCEKGCVSQWLPNLQRCEELTTQDQCQLNNRGVWNTATSSCKICNDNAANCLACKADNSWDTDTSSCLNINIGQQYCDIKGESYTWITDTISSTYSISLVNGRCLACNTSSNVCVNACKRSWDSVASVCLTCNSSQSVCVSSCGKDWIPPSTCVKCSTSLSICQDTCGWYWDTTVATCINCNTSLATCQNSAKCNGSWDSVTSTCNLCNLNVNNCENKCFFVYSTQSSTCLNCQQSQSVCEQSCGYVWDPTLSSNKCILCNMSKAICEATGTYKCAGFWLATNKCTQYKCNQDEATCENKCLMNWNSKLSTCLQCTETQYLDGSNVCQECSGLTTSALCAANCAYTQFFWDSTATVKCRGCASTEYWNGSACVMCSTIHTKCTKCAKVSGTATCLACSDNYRVISATLCDCITDRMPNALSVCTLCSVLIANCAECSILGTCDLCKSGYSWDPVGLTCRAQFTFSSNTLSGVAFVTDFQVVMSYPNAAVPAGTIITYSVYLYNTEAEYLAELSNFLVPNISVGVLYLSGLIADKTYTLKLKSGFPVLAPLVIVNGAVIPPQDQYLKFTVTKQFVYLDQFTKYANSMLEILTPKDFYYKMIADELLDQYYDNACSNCPSGISCITNTKQCDCSTVTTSAGTTKTLYDCSGLDKSEFNELVTTLFGHFKDTASTPQGLEKVHQLLPHLNTADNDSMTVDLFMYYTSQIPVIVDANTSPTAADILLYDDIIRRVVSYTNLMMKNSLAKTADQLYLPYDRLLTTIFAVMSTQSQYLLETMYFARFSAASLGSASDLITRIDIKKLMEGTSNDLFVSSSSLSSSGGVKASRFYYKYDPFFVGNSTFKNYKNYPYIEYFVQTKTGTTLSRTDVSFTFIYNVTEVKQSTKCVQREQNGQLQLCEKTELDSSNLRVTCTCKNSGTLIEKIILVEPNAAVVDDNNYLLYIILACTLGLALTLFLVFIFFYLKKLKDLDKFKILKKQRNGQRQIDPNMSLDDFDLSVEEEEDSKPFKAE